MATGDRDFIPNYPPDYYVPIPFPPTYPKPGTGGGNSGGDNGGGNGGPVYAAALFIQATCQSTDNIGAWVRATDTASAVTSTTSQLSYPAIGVIVSKSSATACVVQTYGLCAGVYSGLTPNLRLFVGPDSQASIGPDLPSGTAYVQPVGFSVRSDTIFVQPSGTLFRRDAAADSSDPAPPPDGGGVATYQPVLHGVGAPDAGIGQPGSAYIATDLLQIFVRGDSGWGSGTSLATGGPKGDPGTPGSRIYRVQTLPQDGSGYNAGDIFIDDQGNVAQVEST